MTSDIHLAIAHPVERTEAMARGNEPRDRLSLRDHVVEVEIGAFQSERGQTQRVRFNVVVELRPQTGPVDDDVDKILSYDTITEAIATELASERLNLLETLAERIALRLLREPQPMRVFVRVEKLDRGPGALGVEIVRDRRPELTQTPAEQAAEHPVVVYLSNAAIAAGDLTAWVDRLAAGDAPVILCVGAGDTPAPVAAHPLAQRRIDLLAIEQNAWVLAARDPRCVVTNTRTEIDWAMKHDQICVWAPSKIVLDAVDGPSSAPNDAMALALWFGKEVSARRMVVIDDAPATDVPEGVEVLSLKSATDAL